MTAPKKTTSKKQDTQQTQKLSDSVKRKLSLLELAQELGNVSKACELMGYHRDTFYEVRRAFQVGGVAALLEKKRGPKGPHPNRVAPEIEEKILDYALEKPTHGAQRVASELRLQGVSVSGSGVRGVWLRHDLERRTKRILRLEKHAQQDTFVPLQPSASCLAQRPRLYCTFQVKGDPDEYSTAMASIPSPTTCRSASSQTAEKSSPPCPSGIRGGNKPPTGLHSSHLLVRTG